MSDPEPKLPPAEEEWLHRFFWMRGLVSGDLASAQAQVRRLVGAKHDHQTVRLAAIAVLQTMNALPKQRERLLRLAQHLSHSSLNAEDLVQTTLGKALHSPDAYRLLGGWNAPEHENTLARHEEARHWLNTILRNEWIDTLRKANAQPSISLNGLIEQGIIPEMQMPSANSPVVTWRAEEERHLFLMVLQDALDVSQADTKTLPLIEVFVARYLSRMTRKDTAELFGLTVSQVRSREDLAVKWLRQRLQSGFAPPRKKNS